jgi:hypothetical protein
VRAEQSARVCSRAARFKCSPGRHGETVSTVQRRRCKQALAGMQCGSTRTSSREILAARQLLSSPCRRQPLFSALCSPRRVDLIRLLHRLASLPVVQCAAAACACLPPLRRFCVLAELPYRGACARCAGGAAAVDGACIGRGSGAPAFAGSGFACAVCGSSTAAVCARSRLVGYCGAVHVRKDRPAYKHVCSNGEFGVVRVPSWEQRMLAEAAAAAPASHAARRGARGTLRYTSTTTHADSRSALPCRACVRSRAASRAVMAKGGGVCEPISWRVPPRAAATHLGARACACAAARCFWAFSPANR